MRIMMVGFGVVGRSLAKLINRRRDDLLRLYGLKPRIVAVVDSKGATLCERGLDLNSLLSCKKEKGSVSALDGYGKEGMDALEVMERVDADVFIDVTPTDLKDGEPSLTYLRRALRLGMNVVTTNKGPLALSMPTLLDLAKLNGVRMKFGGTVGGGTPILNFAKKCLYGDRIVEIKGILNGTTNYILSRMEEGMEFDLALKEAQELGYAEADPRMDVEGYDPAAKLVILANWILGKRATLEDVEIRGIRGIGTEDFEEAMRKGETIKLLCIADGGLRVGPSNVKKGGMLDVKGSLNAVTFVSETAGEETVVGKGAGGMETASAVLRDLIDIRMELIGGRV